MIPYPIPPKPTRNRMTRKPHPNRIAFKERIPTRHREKWRTTYKERHGL